MSACEGSGDDMVRHVVRAGEGEAALACEGIAVEWAMVVHPSEAVRAVENNMFRQGISQARRDTNMHTIAWNIVKLVISIGLVERTM